MLNYLKDKLKVTQERREGSRENIPARPQSICKGYTAGTKRSRRLS